MIYVTYFQMAQKKIQVERKINKAYTMIKQMEQNVNR